MKLHLPSSLRSALLSCLSASFVLSTGSGVLQAGEQELTFNGATLNWTTAPENQVFTAADSSPAAFAPGDNVYFTGTTQVTLGEDIAVGILGVEAGAHVDITPGAYALEAERIELSGTLDYGSALHIGEGQTLAVEGAGSVLDSALVLQDNGAIEVAAVANLNNNSLSMQGGTALSLDTTGDGRVYNLFTGVSSLLDAQGNTLVLNTTNNAVSNYFDTTRPGTGFWAGATLQLTTDGTLQLVRHSETVKDALTITTRQTDPREYAYYASIAFNNINASNFYGGAICGRTIISNNDTVEFSENSISASTLGRCAIGGAIYGSDIELRDNGSVEFNNNTASSSYHFAWGGAVCGRTIILNNNDSVTFSGNAATADGVEGSAGGAIHIDENVTLSNNGSITFRGNTVAGAGPRIAGGAIFGSTITLSKNGSVTFRGNMASSGEYAEGGAIFGFDIIALCDNGSVTFNGNSVNGSGYATGGAIYAYNLSIQNNDSVLFEKNAEITNGTYRLRSVYAGNYYRGSEISLSAAAGNSIEFRDSVYFDSGPTVYLNADYTNSEGNVIKQEGDIIFTGAYAETHLNELLTAAEAGRTATAEEIANSRTSEMHGKVTLYGGTLRVEEQAVLKTSAGLEVAAGSTATVKVSNAELDADSSDINVGDSGTLMLMNGATVKAANINIADGATFAVVEAPAQEAVATFSLREAASVAELPQSCLVNANLTLEAGSTLVADGVYFSMTEGSTLTFKALTGGNKINLVLTLGAEYSDNEQVVLFSDADVVRFVLDGVELSSIDSILASTFFTGAWVNDETTLSYDSSSGTISVQHLNTVSIPEPTTATLSLLALAALAARRRRK